MKRLIYSIYIEVPDSEFVDNQKTNLNTKKELKENYQRLIDCKQQYADSIGADFVLINKYEDQCQISKGLAKENEELFHSRRKYTVAIDEIKQILKNL